MYGRLEWKAGNMWDGGRDLEGPDVFEYCESLFFEAWERGRCKFVRRTTGDVIRGGNGG